MRESFILPWRPSKIDDEALLGDPHLKELSKYREHWKAHLALAWRDLLGLAALLDFLATVLPDVLRANHDVESSEGNHAEAECYMYEAFGHPIPAYPVGSMIHFLNDNAAVIGFFFSMVCLVEAFLDARRTRDRTIKERDRKRLMKMKQDEEDESINIIEDLGFLDDNFDSYLAFYARLLWQLLLLPAGFYWLISRGAILEAEINFRPNNIDGVIEEERVEEMFHESYAIDRAFRGKNISLGFYILKRIISVISVYTRQKGLMIKNTILQKVKKALRRIFSIAIWNPRTFLRSVKNILTALRWVKYLQPIFGASNKLKGNLADLTKKFRQRRESLLMQKLRRRIIRQMTSQERLEYSVRKIQAAYRGHRARKSIRAVQIIRGQHETMAALRMQKQFRASLARARARIRRKRIELERLKHKAEAELPRMSPEERQRMYELEEELQLESARILNRRLILKPDTTFAVTWKSLFCLCVIFEIAGLVWNPLLKSDKDKATGEAISMITVIKRRLVPLPTSDLKECSCMDDVSNHWKARVVLGWKRRKILECGPAPWFCEAPYSTMRSIYIQLLECIIDDFLLFVGLIVFLDVPVSFFTGEIDEMTGETLPKPFFQRWILPGLGLQLLVNPKMASTSKAVWAIGHEILDIGPVRVFRWAYAFVFPLFVAVFDYLEGKVWLPLVRSQNHKSLALEASAAVFSRQRL